MSSLPIQWLIKRRNFFVSPLMKRSLLVKLSDAEFNHYRDVVPTPESREGIAVFPREIRAAKPWLAELAPRVEAELAKKPILLTWGMKDPAFARGTFLKRWESTFSDVVVVKMAKAGHYIQEDAPDQIAEAIRSRFGG